MQDRLPLVTIITATYKHEKYLRKTIDSVLEQDYPNIEYIVINDGSPDGTEEILKSYGNRFHWETQENMGEVPTLSRAIAMAKGELVGKLSSDDYLYPHCVSESVKQFMRTPESAVVYANFDLVDTNDGLIQNIVKPDGDEILAVRDHLCLPGTGALFRKNVFEQVGGFHKDFKILFDMYFWWCASLYGKITRIPLTLSAFRYHDGSQSNMAGLRMAMETVACVKQFYSFPNLPQKFIKIKHQAFSNAYYAAAMQTSQEKDLFSCKKYLLYSFMFSPFNYFRRENRSKAKNFIDIMLSPAIGMLLKRFFK